VKSRLAQERRALLRARETVEDVASIIMDRALSTTIVTFPASALSIYSCRIASCNRLSNCFASSRSRPRFAGPNWSGARRSQPTVRLRVSPLSNVVSTKNNYIHRGSCLILKLLPYNVSHQAECHRSKTLPCRRSRPHT